MASVTVKCYYVVRKAEDYLRWVDNEIKSIKQEAIELVMERHILNPFPPKTVEEAIAKLESDGYKGFTNYTKCESWWNVERGHIERILKLCRVSNDGNITLTDRDVFFLKESKSHR